MRKSILLLALVITALSVTGCKNSRQANEIIRIISVIARNPQFDEQIKEYDLLNFGKERARRITFLSPFFGDGLTVRWKQVQLGFLPVWNYSIRIDAQVMGVRYQPVELPSEWSSFKLARLGLSGWDLYAGKVALGLVLLGFLVVERPWE